MWNPHQIWNPMTVLKSACHEDSKTPPTCSIWWRSGDTVTKTDAVPVDRAVNDDTVTKADDAPVDGTVNEVLVWLIAKI